MWAFSRNKMVWIGIGIIFLIYFINKFTFIIGSEFTDGKIIKIHTAKSRGRYGRGITYQYPVIEFKIKDYVVTFTSDKDYLEHTRGDIVPVIYKTANPTDARMFTLTGFWLVGWTAPILFVSLLVWFSFSTSFFSKKTVFEFEYRKFKLRIVRPLEEIEKPRFGFRSTRRRKR